MIAVHCPHCGYGMMFSDDKYGKSARCRKCESIVKIVPPAPVVAPVPAPVAASAAAVQTQVNVRQEIAATQRAAKSKLVYFLFWFFVGGLGAHRFYAGEIAMGIALFCSFLATIFTFGLWFLPHMIWFIVIEGIILLRRKDLY